MTLRDVRDALIAICPETFHNKAYKQTDSYIVWREFGENTMPADDEVEETAARIAVDYFTKTEYDDTCATIRKALEEIGAAVDDARIDYEDDTGYTHYSMVCEVV